MSNLLSAMHLYPKVPRDLTDATRLGGALSIACAATIAYLFASNLAQFLATHTTTTVALDDSLQADMRIFFNITMENLPCQFAAIDVSDIMGTALTNISQQIVKFKVNPGDGHREGEYYMERADEAIEHEELAPDALVNAPVLAQLDADTFEPSVKSADVVLVAFGAPWCPWTQRLDPVWRKTAQMVAEKSYASRVRIASVDCTKPGSTPLCRSHHIHAFPTIRIFRHRQVRSHENYLGDRTTAAFLSFVEELLPPGALPADTVKAPAAQVPRAEAHSLEGEGCRIIGTLKTSRVPGSFRVRAASAAHSFNTRVMNVTHHVDKLVFGEHATSLGSASSVGIEQRSSLYRVGFTMQQELSTLKHYLKVVPFDYVKLDRSVERNYLYKASFNEYRPRKLEWYEGKADSYIDTDLTPNAAFHYDVSPVKVVVLEEALTWASFVTRICAVIGGVYTVIGLFDNVLYHSARSLKMQS